MIELHPQDNEGTTPTSGSRKRARDDDSDIDAPESKLARVDSGNSDLVPSKLDVDMDEPGFDTDNSVLDSPEAKRIQDELLSVLDDSDEPPIQGLDSVIKSFAEEILPATEMDSFPGEAQPDLGYLLEASDDELGLPPTFSTDNISGAAENSPVIGDFYGGFDNGLPDVYESFELGIGDGNGVYNEGEGYVALGGLFDYSDESLMPGNVSGSKWEAETLPALYS